MSGREEHAAGDRRNEAFPPEWGHPRGERFSEERAGWIASRVRQLIVLRKARPEDLRARLARKRLGP